MTFPRLSIRRLGAVQLGKMLQPDPKADSDTATPYLRAAHVQPGGVLDMSVEPKTMFFSSGELQQHDLRRGDVVVVEGGAGFGRAAVLDRDLAGWGFQNSIVRIRPNVSRSHGGFIAYALQAALSAGEIEVACFTSTIPHFTADKVSAFELPAPPLATQRRILNYLNRETAQIDTLISEQERLREQLEARRFALIANATGWGEETKGWPMKRLSWLFGRSGSGTTPRPEAILAPTVDTVPWLTTGELREQRIWSTRKAVSKVSLADYSALRVHPAGSLAVAMYGATIGRLAVLGIEAATNQACCVFSDPQEAVPEFVQYSLIAARPWLLLEASGGGQPNINQDKLRSFRIPAPDLVTQAGIVERLDEEVQRIDSLVREVTSMQDLARERRAALITAAVTGLIEIPED